MAERNDRPQRARRPKKKVCMFCVDKVEHIRIQQSLEDTLLKEARSCQDVSAVTVQSTKDSLQQLSSVQEL